MQILKVGEGALMPTNFICLYALGYNTLRNIFIFFSSSYIQSVITGENIALWGDAQPTTRRR